MNRLRWMPWPGALPFASAGGGLLCVLVAFVLAGIEPPATTAPVPPSLRAALDSAAYVGDQACQSCHTGRPEHTPFTQNHYTDVPLGITVKVLRPIPYKYFADKAPAEIAAEVRELVAAEVAEHAAALEEAG